MKKLKLVLTTLCLVGALALAFPMTTARAEGPQNTSNSAPKPPPPPAPDWLVHLMAALMSVF